MTLEYRKNREILEAANKEWGAAFASDMLIEEMSELTTAIMHQRRGRIEPRKVCEEMVDVRLTLDGKMLDMQRIMPLYSGTFDFEKSYDEKMNRLALRLPIGTVSEWVKVK